MQNKKRVAIIGAGGNIGSHLVPHIARIRNVREILLIDPDIYEEKNIYSQDIKYSDVGKPKVIVQERRIQKIRQDIKTTAIKDMGENIPPGLLNMDVILTCLDSRIARMYVNQIAFRLGVPWIDAGVDGKRLLARVSMYIPSEENPCLECGWDERNYNALEQVYPCLDFKSMEIPTNAPSAVGSLSASIQAIECMKLLEGDNDHLQPGSQVLVDAKYQRHTITKFQRNKKCRFDHKCWEVKDLDKKPGEIRLKDALSLLSSYKDSFLFVEWHKFAIRLKCKKCGHSKDILYLSNRLATRMKKCRDCGDEMIPVGFYMKENLNQMNVPQKSLNYHLSRLGFKPGDIFTVSNGDEERHYCIG